MADAVNLPKIPLISVGNLVVDGTLKKCFLNFIGDEKIQTVLNKKPDQIVEALLKTECGIILFGVKAQQEILDLSGVLVKCLPLIRAGRLKTLGVLGLPSSKLETHLKKQGVTEILLSPVQEKTLMHKLAKNIEMVAAARAKPIISAQQAQSNEVVQLGGANKPKISAAGAAALAAATATADSETEAKSETGSPVSALSNQDNYGSGINRQSAKSPEGKNASTSQDSMDKQSSAPAAGGRFSFEWIPNIASPSDCWVLLSKKDLKRSMGRVFLDLLGPPPSHGGWHPSKIGFLKGTESKEKIWVFRVTQLDELFNPEPGLWYFHGQLPEYSWETYLWSFVGKEPQLYFKPSAGELQPRMKSLPMKIQMNLDRPDAPEYVEKLREILMVERAFRQEGSKGTELSIEAKARQSLLPEPKFKLENDVRATAELSIQLDEDEKPEWNMEDIENRPAPETLWNPLTGDEVAALDDDVDWEEELKDLRLKVFIVDKEGGTNTAKFLDLFESELTIQVDASAPGAGEPIGVLVTVAGAMPPITLSLRGTVQEKVPMADGKFELVLDVPVTPEQKSTMDKFMKTFESRQEAAGNFLSLAKGE